MALFDHRNGKSSLHPPIGPKSSCALNAHLTGSGFLRLHIWLAQSLCLNLRSQGADRMSVRLARSGLADIVRLS